MAQKKTTPAKAKPRVSALAAAVASADPSETRNPLFDEGTFDVTFLGLEELPVIAGRDPWIAAKFSSEETGERAALFCVSSKSLASTGPRIKSLVMAVIGCTDKDEYDQFDPDGSFVDAMMGYDNEKSATAAEYIGAATVRVIVSRGKETDNGDWFRNHSFAAVEAAEAAE